MLDPGEIPRNILVGRKRGYTSVWTIYKNRFVWKFMELLNKSFWDRSQEGQTDELGNKWDPLSEKYKKRKLKMAHEGYGTPQQTGDYRFGYDYNVGTPGGFNQNYGTLNPVQRATYEKLFQREFRKAQKTTTDAKARERARRAAMGHFRGVLDTDFESVPINIRTGRLVAATAPGMITANRYNPPTSDQTIAIDEDSITIDFTNIEYAENVDGRREIIPEDCLPFVKEAHDYALEFATEEYKRIKEGRKSKIQLAKQRERRRINKINRDNDVPF